MWSFWVICFWELLLGLFISVPIFPYRRVWGKGFGGLVACQESGGGAFLTMNLTCGRAVGKGERYLNWSGSGLWVGVGVILLVLLLVPLSRYRAVVRAREREKKAWLFPVPVPAITATTAPPKLLLLDFTLLFALGGLCNNAIVFTK